jgi:hypothetical protein
MTFFLRFAILGGLLSRIFDGNMFFARYRAKNTALSPTVKPNNFQEERHAINK